MGSIVWQKPTNMHTSGGQKVMGSYPYPRNGIVKIDFEHILLFKKDGKPPVVSHSVRQQSAMTDEEWQSYFSSHWTFGGARQDGHIAVFPEELPKRLIKMYSFVGDTILDPFIGSGTTALAARNLGRNSIGYEINPNFMDYYREKVTQTTECTFNYDVDNKRINIEAAINRLPFRFIDVHRLNKQVDVKENTFGSVMEDKNINENSHTMNK